METTLKNDLKNVQENDPATNPVASPSDLHPAWTVPAQRRPNLVDVNH
jgi:hypothetical protein